MVELLVFSAGTSVEVAVREGNINFSTLSALQAVSAPCQADFFGASRSVPWVVTFFWALLNQAGLRNCLDLWCCITPTPFRFYFCGGFQYLIPLVSEANP